MTTQQLTNEFELLEQELALDNIELLEEIYEAEAVIYSLLTNLHS